MLSGEIALKNTNYYYYYVKFHRATCEFIFRLPNVAKCLFLHLTLITDPDDQNSRLYVLNKLKFFTDTRFNCGFSTASASQRSLQSTNTQCRNGHFVNYGLGRLYPIILYINPDDWGVFLSADFVR